MARKQVTPTAEQIAAWRANGFVVTTFQRAIGKYAPRGRTVYATVEEALTAATVDSRNGYMACVDYAHPYGLGLAA